ncbi:MAG TPA: metallophosphoesterase family protein [Gaiellaceae bacterium]|nr:metallophosphoesterase family protein [Gaiellaceae bacterium]
MRIAVLSDVHSNLHALEAVLAEVDAGAFDAIWCLGDVVGYGPRPNECAALIRERADICLAGNHDLVVLGKIPIVAFAGEAAAAATWTNKVLDAAERDFLATLQPSAVATDAELFHGSPRDPVWDYVLTEDAARQSFAATAEPLVLVGHSHVALELSSDGVGIRGGLAEGGTEVDLGGPRRLLNPGSVGQPRDGDPRAAWLEIDKTAVGDSRGRARFRRTAYPVELTQAEIRAEGLPEILAERLAHGA